MATQVSMTLEELREQALKLPLLERLELAEALFDSVDAEDEEEDPADAKAAWANEIKDRIDEFDAGTAESSPVAEVFERVRSRLKRITDAQAQLR
jgi:putative addiction module component (TIGR02574 family)